MHVLEKKASTNPSMQYTGLIGFGVYPTMTFLKEVGKVLPRILREARY